VACFCARGIRAAARQGSRGGLLERVPRHYRVARSPL